MEWKPIETAPKSGEDILACNQFGVVICSWRFTNLMRQKDGKYEEIYGFVSNGSVLEPTHWMELPVRA